MQRKNQKKFPLQVLLLVESATTGVGRHVIDLAGELVQRGHSVHIVYSTTNTDARFLAGIKPLVEAGCRAIGRKMYHGGHPSDASLIFWLRQYILREGPFDVVHCHSTKAGFIGRLAAMWTGSRVFYTPHAFLTMKPGLPVPVRWTVAAIEASLARLSHRIIAVSERENRHGRAIGIPASRLATVPNGATIARRQSIDNLRQELRASYGIPQDAITVGFVGRLSSQKAPDHLLSSFAALKKQIGKNHEHHVRLLMVGEGPLYKELKAQCHQLGLDECVHWLGTRDGEEAVCTFDIFALPSDYEGLPYVVLEAMSAGNPIVTTDVGGMKELVTSGVNGYVVPCRNVFAFANAMATLIVDSELRRRMSVASSERIKQFSTEQMAENILSLYRS